MVEESLLNVVFIDISFIIPIDFVQNVFLALLVFRKEIIFVLSYSLDPFIRIFRK
jgi:hypothetical protein